MNELPFLVEYGPALWCAKGLTGTTEPVSHLGRQGTIVNSRCTHTIYRVLSLDTAAASASSDECIRGECTLVLTDGELVARRSR